MQIQTDSLIFSLQVGDSTSATVIDVNVDAAVARRRVSGWVGGYVSTSCGARAPMLIVRDAKPFWRVPVVLTRIGVGVVGEIGAVHVDAQTGELTDATEQHAEELRQAGIALADRTPAAPFKIRTAPTQYVKSA